MAVRGNDGEGIWHDPDLPLGLASRRRAVIELGRGGAQPMESPSGRYVMICDAALANRADLYIALEKTGHVFGGRSDAEVMLAACEQWGVNHALQKFDGMFAFALWDRKDQTLHLARDPFGEKPLYAGLCDDGFYFASSPVAWRAHPDFKAEIDRAALGAYMRYGFFPAPCTIYRTICKLPAGTRLTVPLHDFQAWRQKPLFFEPYRDWARMFEEAWQKRAGQTGNMLQNEAQNEDVLDGLIERAVRRRMMADIPAGILLSDTPAAALIAHKAQQNAGFQVASYSLHVGRLTGEAQDRMKMIATHAGTDHTAVTVDGKMLGQHIIRFFAEAGQPSMATDFLPLYICGRQSGQDPSLWLTDTGYDFLAHRPRLFGEVGQFWDRYAWLPPALRAKAYNLAGFGKRHDLSPYKTACLQALRPDDLYLRLIGHELPDFLAAALPDGAAAAYENRMDSVRGGHAAGRMGLCDLLYKYPDETLASLDTAGMAAGAEARAPLVDSDIFNFFKPRLFATDPIAGCPDYFQRLFETAFPVTLSKTPGQQAGTTSPDDLWAAIAPHIDMDDVCGRQDFCDPVACRDFLTGTADQKATTAIMRLRLLSILLWHHHQAP